MTSPDGPGPGGPPAHRAIAGGPDVAGGPGVPGGRPGDAHRSDGTRAGGGSGDPGSAAGSGGTGAGRLRLCLSLLLVVALAATVGLGFHRVFGFGDLGPVLGGAVVPPVLLTALVSWPRRRTWPLWTSIAAAVTGWALVAGVTLFHGDFTMIGGALRDSWKATLTTLLPAPGRPEFLVLPHVLVWFAAVAGAEGVLRSRTRALPAVPAVAVFGVALLLGVGGSVSGLPYAAALVGLTGVLVMARTPGRPGRLLAGVPVAVVLALVAALAGPRLPVAGTPYDPRETVKAPPPQQRDSVSPLDRVSAWLQSPDQQMFTVRAGTPENWRLAVLDRFDGVTWTSGGGFVPVGTRVPIRDHARRNRVDQRFSIQDLPGVWVPAADRPAEIDGLAVTVDPPSGVLTSARPLHSGQAYSVTSMVPDYDVNALTAAEPARDAQARAAVDLPESPGTTAGNAQVPGFRRLARRITRDESTGFQRAAKLADYLRTAARYDVTGLPGHTYAQLDYFLTWSRRGTSEQFATAYAVLARSIGLPTRVVVGFRPGVGGNGEYQVRSGDVLVWPEVDFAGLGWVPFYPTPEQQGRSRGSDSVPAGKAQQKLEQAQQNAAKHKEGGSGGRTPPSPKPAAPRRAPAKPAPGPLYALAAAGTPPILYLIAVLVVPPLRRHRRRSAQSPAERVAGAWCQTLESLRGVGLPRPDAMTAHEVAGFGARRMDGADRNLRALADLVNRSAYAAVPAGPDIAEEAWRHTDEIGRLARRDTGLLRRVGRRLHPRSLRLR